MSKQDVTMSNNQSSLALLAIVVLHLSPSMSIAKTLTGDELRTLYANDVTECGEYPNGDKLIQ